MLLAGVAYVVFLRRHPRELVAEFDHRLAPRRALAVAGIYGLVVDCFGILYWTRILVI